MKKYVLLLIALLIGACVYAQTKPANKNIKRAKYIFFFIGDGMGLAQVSAAETYLSELNGKLGGESLSFTQFPVMGVATTYSANRGITCSAAAGTALATGTKTNNNILGMNPDSVALTSIASKFKKAGYRVGITTSVGINHATPAAFYGHQPDREMYYEIGMELPATGFDFFAGSSMMEDRGKKKDKKSLYEVIAESGYGIARGVGQYDSVKNISKKMIWVENPDTLEAVAYAIDRKGGELTLPQIVDKAIGFLNQKNTKGFFLMAEGGKIDWAGHSNDAGANIREVLDFSEAVQKAVDFYKAHPNETLIIITADHETGGFALGETSGYRLNTQVLKNQKISKDELYFLFKNLKEKQKGQVSWDDIKSTLRHNLGFWNTVELSSEDEQALKNCYQKEFVEGISNTEESLYAAADAMSTLAIRILDNTAKLGWTTSSHSGITVPVYAIGVGSSEFAGKIDNTDIPKKIMKAAKVVF